MGVLALKKRVYGRRQTPRSCRGEVPPCGTQTEVERRRKSLKLLANLRFDVVVVRMPSSIALAKMK